MFTIKMNKTVSLLTILYVFLFIPNLAFSQANKNIDLLNAIQLFDERNYTEAETLFKKVLTEKPQNFMVNYFYGACRTENNHFTNTDLDCLIQANQEVSPVNINYYFGKQYHARNNWERALKFYNIYNSKTSLSEIEKQELLNSIQQCYDKINPYKIYIIAENNEEDVKLAITSNLEVKTPMPDKPKAIPGSKKIKEEKIKKKSPTNESISFYINDKITYLSKTHFKTKEGKNLYEKANSKQEKLEFTLKKVDKLRENYSNSKTRDEKNSIGKKILTLENESFSVKQDFKQLYMQAKNLESDYWKNASPKENKLFVEELTEISKQNNIRIDTVPYINPNILLGNKLDNLQTEVSKNDDLIYKIQIGAFSRGLPTYIKRLYNKLSLIRKIENYTDENGVVVYTTGNLNNYEDAIIMQNQVRQEGVEDAYVVPYFKRKRITLAQAKELIKE